MTALELMKIVQEHNKNCRFDRLSQWVDMNRADIVALACINEMPLNVPLRCKHVADIVPASTSKISYSLRTLVDLNLVRREEVEGDPIEVPLYYGATETHWVTPRRTYYTRIK